MLGYCRFLGFCGNEKRAIRPFFIDLQTSKELCRFKLEREWTHLFVGSKQRRTEGDRTALMNGSKRDEAFMQGRRGRLIRAVNERDANGAAALI